MKNLIVLILLLTVYSCTPVVETREGTPYNNDQHPLYGYKSDNKDLHPKSCIINSLIEDRPFEMEDCSNTSINYAIDGKGLSLIVKYPTEAGNREFTVYTCELNNVDNCKYNNELHSKYSFISDDVKSEIIIVVSETRNKIIQVEILDYKSQLVKIYFMENNTTNAEEPKEIGEPGKQRGTNTESRN